MSGPRPPRPGEALDDGALGAWLDGVLGGHAPIEVLQYPGGHSNLTYLVRRGDTAFVLRRPPFGSKVKSAHDMGREHTVLSALAPVYPNAPRPIALCTDGGGSTRRPAAHAGVVGMKPSAGLVPHPTGFAEPLFGNAVIGQMGRRVADVVAMLDAIAVPSLADPQGLPVALWNGADADPARLPAGLRIAFSPRLGLDVPVDDEVAASVEAAVARLDRAGYRVVRADPPWPAGFDHAFPMVLQHAGLAALHGDALRRAEWEPDPDIAQQIEAGLRLSGADVAAALFARDALYPCFTRFFAQHDLLLTPTLAAPPPEIGHLVATADDVDLASLRVAELIPFTAQFNATGQPAMSLPLATSSTGLPIGTQLVAGYGREDVLFRLAGQIEAAAPWAQRVPTVSAA